ncbi:uncharacterized protein [Antedon mediterranea]|uniref:uncharacterized protein n=1 Tax=Antedon mediterranea TaxID=105859 RepID=UPI003AF7B0CE
MALAPDTNGTESSSLVITCKGNINDTDLTEKLQKIRLQLTELSESDDDSLSISKIEPWNSVRVTFNIPPEAAQRLQQLAQTDSQVLQNLGILSVQIENNDQVNIPPPQLSSSISHHVLPLTSVGLGKSVMSSAPPTSSQIRMTVANQQQQQVNTINFGGMRPNFPWGQVQMPRMQGNLPVGMQGNITQGNVPAGMQPGIQPGVQFNLQQGIQQNMQGQGMHGNIQTGGNIQPGMSSPNMQGSLQGGIPSSIQTTMQSGRQSAMQTNIQTSVQQGMHPNMQSNMQGGPMPLGLQAAMQPGMQGNMPPGLQGNMPPGMQMNMQPGMQQSIQSGMPPGMQGNIPPGLQGNMQPGIQGSMQPGIQGGMQPGIQGGMQPGIQSNMQPGIQGGMQPGIQGGMQPGIQGGMQPNIHAMQQGMNPNVPPFNQMPQFFYPGEIQRFGLNMSPPSDIRPKKKRRSRPKAKKKGSEKDKDETETTDVQPKHTDISKSDMKSIAPPINQMIPATNSGHSVANHNQPVATSAQFVDQTQPTTTSNLAVKKPDVSITSPLLVNLLQREIPGTQFPFSNRGGIPTSLASTLQHAAILNSKKMNNMPQSTLSQGLPPMPPASEITRMLPESIGLPPLPTSQVVSSIPSHMSSPQSNVLMTSAVRSQTPNRQQNVSQPVATQHFQPHSDENQINQPTGDGTHNLFSAQQNIPASNAAGVMSLQQPSSVLQPGLGASYGQIEQCRRTPTPLSNNMSPPVRLSGMQSPGPNKLPFAAPGMTNANIPHGLPTSLQQSQVPTSAGPTAVYQQGLNPMMQQGQRQFLTPTTQIRNQLPFPLQLQQQQQTQLNQYFPSNITPGQTPSNQGIDFAHGANFNPGNMFPQRQPAPGNLPFNMVNIPTSNLAQFRMPLPADVSHPGNKGMMPGPSGNMMQTPPVGMMPGKSPVRYRGNHQIPHATHLPPTNIMFPSIPRFPAKPQNNMVMPFDETTLDGISDAEKDLLAMAEKVANEAGMETSNRMANLFSKDNKQTEVISNEMLLKKDPTQLKEMDSIKVPLGETVKSGDVKQQKSPVIQLTKQPHDMFMAGDTQNIASWSSTILPIHGKDRYSIHTHTTTGNGDKKLTLKGDENSQFKTQVLPEGGPSSNSLNSHQPSSFSLPVEAASKSGSSQGTVGADMPPFETGAHYVSMPSTEGPCQNTNFISQYNSASAVVDKKLNNPPVSVDELHRKNIFGMNVNAPTQNLNQGVVQEQKVSDKSSILMQMIHMDSMRNNSGMINLTRSVSEPVGSHGVPSENISVDSIKMPTLERMTHDNENSSLPQQQEISKDVAELNAEYVPKTTVSSASQPLMPQLVPKQLPQQKQMYSPKSLLLPSCMPPPGHGSTGNLTNSETQKSGQFDKRARSVSPVTQQGSEFPRLPLTSASFINQTPSPTTSSPSGMGMSASALLSSIAKSAYNAGMTPRMQSPSENRPSTSQPVVIPAAATTSTPSPTNLPLYANPLGPDAHTKPITVKVSPVTAPEVVKSTPLLPSVLPNVSLASTESNVSPTGDEQPNLTPTKPPEVEQTPVKLPQTTEVPPDLSVLMEETPEQIDSPKLSVLAEQPIQHKESDRSTSTVERSISDDAVREQLTVKEEMSQPDLTQNSSSVQLKRKYDDNTLCDPPPKVLKVDSETKQEEDLKKSANADLTDSDDHRPLPLLVRESTIEVGNISSEKGQTAGDMSLESEESSVATMPTLLPSKVELMDIAKCKDTHQFPFKLESEAQTAGEAASISEPITNPQNSEIKPTNLKETTEAKQESAHIVKKIETPTVNTSKSPPDTSPASSKDSTKSSPVERRTTPKRRAAEEASRPLSERSTPSRQCTLQVDEPPATRARRATRNKSPADHPARLREREDSGSNRDQHAEQGADTDGRMTRKRSTRIIGKGSKDTKDK